MSLQYIWYGHGTHGLETGGYHVLVDPFFTDNPAASTTAGEVPADYILVSHGHGDHIGDAVAIARRTGATVISNFEIASWLENQGVATHPQHLGGGFHHPFGYLKLTLATHGSGLPDGSYGGNPAGFLLTTGEGQKVYLACDTGLFSDMQWIGRGGLDLAVLPIGDLFTMGPQDSVAAAQLLKPERILPAHYNTWEPIAQDGEAWAERVRRETEADPAVLVPGGTLEL